MGHFSFLEEEQVCLATARVLPKCCIEQPPFLKWFVFISSSFSAHCFLWN